MVVHEVEGAFRVDGIRVQAVIKALRGIKIKRLSGEDVEDVECRALINNHYFGYGFKEKSEN